MATRLHNPHIPVLVLHELELHGLGLAASDRILLSHGRQTLAIAPDRSEVVAEVSWEIPEQAEGAHRMEAELIDAAGALLSRNYFEFRVTRDS